MTKLSSGDRYNEQIVDLIMCVYALRNNDNVIFYDEPKDDICDFAFVV